jgi:Fur family zinc uptake transcriptional regulator
MQSTHGKSSTSSERRAPISAHWKSLAEDRCRHLGERLTPARLGAYAELLAANGAVTAYELIHRLEKRQDRKIAPLTVYRHLEFLTRVGLVHRIESTQSYLTCSHPEDTHESQYLLCSDCGRVEEVHSDSLETELGRIATKRGFKPARVVVEVSGTCGDCIGD